MTHVSIKNMMYQIYHIGLLSIFLTSTQLGANKDIARDPLKNNAFKTETVCIQVLALNPVSASHFWSLQVCIFSTLFS